MLTDVFWKKNGLKFFVPFFIYVISLVLLHYFFQKIFYQEEIIILKKTVEFNLKRINHTILVNVLHDARISLELLKSADLKTTNEKAKFLAKFVDEDHKLSELQFKDGDKITHTIKRIDLEKSIGKNIPLKEFNNNYLYHFTTNNDLYLNLTYTFKENSKIINDYQQVKYNSIQLIFEANNYFNMIKKTFDMEYLVYQNNNEILSSIESNKGFKNEFNKIQSNVLLKNKIFVLNMEDKTYVGGLFPFDLNNPLNKIILLKDVSDIIDRTNTVITQIILTFIFLGGIIFFVIFQHIYKIEKNRMAQSKLLETVMQSITHPFYVINVHDYRIVMSNKVANEKGIQNGCICYEATHKVSSPCNSENDPCTLAYVKKHKKPYSVDHIHYDETGRTINVEIYAHPIFNETGEVVQIIEQTIDVTEKKRMRENLAQSSKLAAVGELAAGVAHEINNPLGIMNLYIKLIQDRLSELKFNDETINSYFSIQKKSMERVVSIINEMRSFTRTSVQTLENVNIEEAIMATLRLIENIYSKENVLIEKYFKATSENINGNFGKIQQIVLNLLSNAKDATEGRSDRIIKIYTKNQEEYIIFEISDNGVGIEKKNMHKIFDTFFTTKPAGKGTGLGLSITYRLVEEMGGSIEVDSKEGLGSIFKVKFKSKT